MRRICSILVTAATLAIAIGSSAEARSLALIRATGTLGLCAHPNLLPYSSRTANPPGFELELGQALAKELGTSLVTEWVVTPYQVPRSDCDILLDVIADAEAQSGSGMKFSKPYYSSGVVLVVPQGSPISSTAALNADTKVGVQTGSIAGMILGQRGIPISIFGPEPEMLQAVADHEIAAAEVTPVAAGYFNLTHPDQPLTILPLDQSEPRLVWNVAVGMRKSDPGFRDAIEQAITKLSDDGVIAGIYSRYGITLAKPR